MAKELIIKNALIVTCDDNHKTIDNGAIHIAGDSIKWVGETRELGEISDQFEVIDANGKLLMPGLINMHSHCGDSLFRGLVEDLPLEQWLNTLWKSQAVILRSADNCRLGAELGFAELLLGGTTTTMDNYWRPDVTIEVAIKTGMQVATGGIFFDTMGMDGYSIEDREQQAHDIFKKYADQPGIFLGTMPHGTYTAGPDSVGKAAEISRQYDGFFSIHAAETKVEQQTIEERYNTSVIRLLHKVNALSNRATLAHCVHVDDEEIDLMAQSGTNVAHNPLSNLKLASGFAPVCKMMDRGVNVALGTDGPISGNDIDMFLAMRLAATIHKAANDDASAISSRQALHMATKHGAKALGASDRLGSIEQGKQADFILLDLSGPHTMPMFDPVSHVAFSASKNDVQDVYIAGRQIVSNRELLTLDMSKIAAEVKALQPAVKAALGE